MGKWKLTYEERQAAMVRYRQDYYQRTREKRLAYQREYAKRNRDRIRAYFAGRYQRKNAVVPVAATVIKMDGRPLKKEVLNSSDILQAPAEKAARLINKILKGGLGYVR